MTQIESKIKNLKQTPAEVFGFLSDFNNYQSLMPQQVTNWESDQDTCTFTISGMASLGMMMEGRTPNSQIRIRKNGKAPFDFHLLCNISEVPETRGTALQLVFDADLNPMLKMMAEKPLENFLNLLVDRYAELTGNPA